MKTIRPSRSRAREGFTLTEVLIAMVILVIVLAGALSLYIVYQRSFAIASLARQTSSESSMALERIVYGPSTNSGLRAAQQSTVAISNPGGGWRIDYNGNRWVQYSPGTEKITRENGETLCENVINSSLEYVTNGCSLSVTVRETGGGRTATNQMTSFVEFRN